MTYIIAEPCVGTCDTACVEVCPVDCIHGPEDKTGAGAEAKADGFDPEGKQLYKSMKLTSLNLHSAISNASLPAIDIAGDEK